jgi:CheY-like chemotaxis protein
MTKESIRTVLLVEDNPADARSLREMLDKGGVARNRIDAREAPDRGRDVPGAAYG